VPFDTATLLNNGKVLISLSCSDWISVDPELYDPIAGTFSSAEAGNARMYPCGPAIVLADGTVLIASGELYDPATDTLRVTGNRTTIGYYSTTATLLPNGKVLVAGGEGDFGFCPNGEVYDPSTGKFTPTGNMIHARSAHTATLLRDGTVLLAGGRVAGGSAEIYDAATGAYASTADMNAPRAYHTATRLMDGRVLIVGGTTADFVDAELYFPSVLIPAHAVTGLQFDRTSVVAGSSFSANVSGSNLTPHIFLDVRFTAPGSNDSAAVLNWQTGLAASHDVPAGTALGDWTINGVRAHEVETDHTGDFVPVSATITVSQ
jgi:hypothetical protein